MVMADRLRHSAWKVALVVQVGLVCWAVVSDGKFFVPSGSGQLPQDGITVVQGIEAFFEAELLLVGMALALAVLVWFARVLSVEGAAWLLVGASVVLGFVMVTQAPKPLALAVLLANPVLVWSFVGRDGRRRSRGQYYGDTREMRRGR